MTSTAYTPDATFAIIGVVVYTILAGIHAFQVVSKEAWDGSFMVLGCLAQAMGCGARLISSWDIHDKLSWVAQKLLLLWGPALHVHRQPIQRHIRKNMQSQQFRPSADRTTTLLLPEHRPLSPYVSCGFYGSRNC
ncbi:hypothetical protein BDV34DRAFT_224417 [Aspergillus parasiticus]|uniref:Uncharacterized protein n=1 Tax=Aspergillus parasiticus TaxID=5067 RepID=A0A5N6DNJ0_ASPPA|nr:hypothetical protein BDV34DRAFT_224417 [Aspergillus parasiticus]